MSTPPLYTKVTKVKLDPDNRIDLSEYDDLDEAVAAIEKANPFESGSTEAAVWASIQFNNDTPYRWSRAARADRWRKYWRVGAVLWAISVVANVVSTLMRVFG